MMEKEVMTEIIIQLPANLAQDASEFGLLDQANIIHLLETQLEERIMQMVNQEIHDYRAEKRSISHPKSE